MRRTSSRTTRVQHPQSGPCDQAARYSANDNDLTTRPADDPCGDRSGTPRLREPFHETVFVSAGTNATARGNTKGPTRTGVPNANIAVATQSRRHLRVPTESLHSFLPRREASASFHDSGPRRSDQQIVSRSTPSITLREEDGTVICPIPTPPAPAAEHERPKASPACITPSSGDGPGVVPRPGNRTRHIWSLPRASPEPPGRGIQHVVAPSWSRQPVTDPGEGCRTPPGSDVTSCSHTCTALCC